ncbi:MAG: TSUP family transporter, partial [Chloroflexota bacterium]
PLRVATATSNLMMGITASAGAIIYLSRGLIDPYIASPTALGVFVGASIGSRVAHRIDVRILRGLFVAILLYTAFQMLLRAFS